MRVFQYNQHVATSLLTTGSGFSLELLSSTTTPTQKVGAMVKAYPYIVFRSSDRIYTCANLCGLVNAYILACSLVHSDNVSILSEKLCWCVNLFKKYDYQAEVSTTYRGLQRGVVADP